MIVFMFLVYDIVCNVFSDNLPPIYSFFAKNKRYITAGESSVSTRGQEKVEATHKLHLKELVLRRKDIPNWAEYCRRYFIYVTRA